MADSGHWERKVDKVDSEHVCRTGRLPGGGAISTKIDGQMNWLGVGVGRGRDVLECFLGR